MRWMDKKLSSTQHDIKLNWELESEILTQYSIENMSRTMRFCNNQQMKQEKFSISPLLIYLPTSLHTTYKMKIKKKSLRKFQSKSQLNLLFSFNWHDYKNHLKILHKEIIFNKVSSHFQITAKIFSKSLSVKVGKARWKERTSISYFFENYFPTRFFIVRSKKIKRAEEKSKKGRK